MRIQGVPAWPIGFFDIVDAPNHAAMLAFSVWYAKEGYGRVEMMPVLSYDDMFGATDSIR